MLYNFLAYDERQMYLLPVSIVKWVQDDSLARFVGETVELLEQRGQLDGFYEGYRKDGWGHPVYHPRMLVKILLYGYCMGVTSSRKLAEAERVDAEEDAKEGKERRGDELPPGLRTREERKTRLEAALKRIEEKKQQAVVKQEGTGKKKRGRKPKDPEAAALEVAKKTKANVTDP